MHPIFALGLPHGAEWLYILLGVVVLFGADRIPKLARGLGKSLGEFKKAKEEFEKEVSAASSTPDPKPVIDQPKVSGNLPEPVHPVPASAVPANTATSVDELTKKI
jgi:sec-independent protein translocase protein TatA